MESTYGFNDKKEKTKIWNKIKKEIVDIQFEIILQKKDESGIYKDHKIYGEYPLPIIFHKYGNQILLTLYWNINIDAGGTNFRYEKKNDGSVDIVIPSSNLPDGTTWRLFVRNGKLPDRYKLLELLFDTGYDNQKYSGYEIKDRGITVENFWFTTNKQYITIYVQRGEAGSWCYSTCYFGDNVN